MTGAETYRYSRNVMGVPSLLIAVGSLLMWLLWPSLIVPPRDRSPSDARTAVAYGSVEESLYMSPLLFARATRVGFQAPEDPSGDIAGIDKHGEARSLRFLHVDPVSPDFNGMKRHDAAPEPVNQVDAYQPLWKDNAVFAPTPPTNRVWVEVSGPLQKRAYRPKAVAWPTSLVDRSEAEIEAYVEVDAEGVPQNVFLEKRSGDAAMDAECVRAMEQGRAAGGAGSAAGRITMMIRRGDEGQN